MSKLYNVSTSPHVRSKLTTGLVMYDVIIALVPATVFGIYHFGVNAAFSVLLSILTAVLAEYCFNLVCKKPNTIKDGSAVVTGLLLALCLPASVPFYIPILGSLFAIIIVKGLFGGIGKNFMNPALAARCFLLISFTGVVTDFKIDGISAATPLVDLSSGAAVDVLKVFLGYSNSVLGGSAAALLIGGIYLIVRGGITFEIPVAAIASFAAVIAIFGGQGLNISFILLHIFAGGILMGAIFMATDPVTSPVTRPGQLIYGCVVGVLSGIFRIYGSSADSVSYAIIISNLVTPIIDEYVVPKPYGLRAQKAVGEEKEPMSKSPIILMVITLVAGLALSGVYALTKDSIAEQEAAAAAASYKEVCPEAESFASVPAADEVIAALEGGVYGTDFGKAYINVVYEAKDASDNTAGYVMSVTSGDTFDGTLTISIGIAPDGTVIGIAFTELHDTAGLGMNCGEEDFYGQFAGVNTDKFTLNKSGGSTTDNDINSVSGASISSGAVVNAVNAALDFFAANLK